MGPDSSRVPSGHTIAGKYRLVRPLGQGGMGTVWLAEHLVLESQVAVKLIDSESEDKEQLVRRFLREAKAAAALNSPHVVRIFDYGVEDGMPYMVMERLEGESLRSRLDREGVLSPELTVTVMTHVARGLAKAHDVGIVHRDLKPDNVFLVGADDELLAKILDFGIAKDTRSFEVSGDTHTGAVIGTPYYLSPEQARGKKDLDHRTDLWALAIMTCECLAGKRPFDADTLGELLLQICVEPIAAPSSLGPAPAGFDAWFAKATVRDPEQRFRSAKEMVAMLRRAISPGAVSVADSTLPDDVPTLRDAVPHAATLPTPAPAFANSTVAVSSSSSRETAPGARPRGFVWLAVAAAVALGAGAFAMTRSGDGAAAPTEGTPAAARPVPETPLQAPAEPKVEPVEDIGPVTAAPPPAPFAGQGDAGAASARQEPPKPASPVAHKAAPSKKAPSPAPKEPKATPAPFDPLKARF